ncbi:MAG: LuxR family transcriptional regulator, partial [Rhodococcus sp. (in: high G+C Gram-positive bacteria)]
MSTALTKPEISARAAARGRPVSGALAGTILSATGGCPATVDVALDAAQRADADIPVTKLITDAVHGYRVEALRAMDEHEQVAVALSHFGVASDVEVLTDLVDAPIDARAVLDGAVAAGVLSGSDLALPDVERALVDVLGKRRSMSALTRLLEYRCKTDSLDVDTAIQLAAFGIKHSELANFLRVAATRATPESAAALYDRAVDAGADELAVAAERAEAAYLAGDIDAAQRFCDCALERFDALDVHRLRTAVRVSATVAAARGMVSRSHQLYTWLGADRVGPDADIAEFLALTAGDQAAAHTATATASQAPPTASSAATSLVTQGLRQSVAATSTADTTSVTHTFMRAVSLAGGTPRALPDSAAAVAALFALHCGDLSRAESTARRGTATLSPRHPDAQRLALVQAWSAMLAGDLTAAQTRVDAMQIPLSHTRNRFFLHALRVGLARRSGDPGSLSTAWEDAQDVVAEYSVDLLSLLPVGELWLGAVRVGQPERVSHLIAQADAVIAGLDEPHAWSSALHWYGVQAAILAERPAELVPHARALALAAETNHFGAALAGAGRAWLAVLQGHPDPADVESAARSLAHFGLSWDGARLASEAAL